MASSSSCQTSKVVQRAGSEGASIGPFDRQQQVWFATREEAVAFAEKKCLTFRVEEPHERVVKVRAYADKQGRPLQTVDLTPDVNVPITFAQNL